MQTHEQMLQAIALEITRHLAANGEAADSAEGIRAWWLPPHLHSAPLEHVIGALERLERDGVVKKRRLGVGFIYAAARPGPTKH